MNLADRMRREYAEMFNAIKDELTGKVVADITAQGYSEIHHDLIFSNEKDKIVEDRYYYKYWRVHRDYRLAIKSHFEELGFVVIARNSPGGLHYGYRIEL